MSLGEELKKQIQSAYSQFLESNKLQARYGQKLMIAAIARMLGGIENNSEGERQGGGHICVVEAGTGTGKTVAYLLATIPVAQMLGKKVVVSTATIALQEQIVFKDLPELKRHSGLAFDYGLVKGRGRYLCLSKLDRLLQADPAGVDFLSDSELNLGPEDLRLYQTMTQKLAENQWDGDRDSWPDELVGPAWNRVTTDHRQCSGRRCSFVRQCAFFRARDSLDEMDCIVANHDLVLADLALGGGAILPAPKDTIYVFDEAHHLPDKALDHFSSHVRLVATSRWLGMTEGQWNNTFSVVAELPSITQLIGSGEAQLKQARTLLDQLQPMLMPLLHSADQHAQTVRYRFPDGQVTDEIEALAQQLAKVFGDLHKLFGDLSNEINKHLEREHGPVALEDLEALYAHVGGWLGRAEADLELWLSYADSRPQPNWPIARWVTLVGSDDVADFELVASPILAAHTLEEHLWQPCYAAVATSATLTALGNFERLKLRAGLPEDAHFDVVPSPFDFAANGVIQIPEQAVDGNRVEEHTASVIRLLPEIVGDREATLVLFASRKQMLEVFDGLTGSWRDKIHMQGRESKQTLLEKHKAQVDQGKPSVLFGLASFAEGVDLPGRYCEHVVIVKIPFAVPDDPVEAAMAEWIERKGGNAFMQMTVPDAAIKMVQAAGRLLRNETDSGRISVLDRRLVSKRYGAAILNSLPPFRRQLPNS